jgi:hypothetical protein
VLCRILLSLLRSSLRNEGMDARVLKISKRKKVVLGIFLVALLSVVVVFALMNTVMSDKGKFYGDQPVEFSATKEFSTNKDVVQAVLKGSIYETGSNMTVFGACLDGKGYLLPSADANFTAWYPNGTIMMQNQPMTRVMDGGNATGRWLIHVTMGDTIGTYFTQIRCDYKNEYAIAFGEWQNPEWVKKIGDTYTTLLGVNATVGSIYATLQGVSVDLNDFRNDVSSNFSQMLFLLQSINGTNVTMTDYTTRLREIYNQQRQMDRSSWVVDAENPAYMLGSEAHEFVAVDVADKSHVAVAGSDGYYGEWDGESWSFGNRSDVVWYGASTLAGPVGYTVYAGRQGGEGIIDVFMLNGSGWRPVYSVNGGELQTINDAWFNATGSSTLLDIAVFHPSNDPIGPVYMYALTSTGVVAFSADQGVTWQDAFAAYGVTELSAARHGRISHVVSNELGAQPGYRVAFIAGDSFAYFDGMNFTKRSVSGTLRDVVLLRDNLGYVTGVDGVGKAAVWKWDGNALTQVYVAQSSNPVSIVANAEDDVWVVTNDPSVYYHYDGFAWKYETFAYSNVSGVLISFLGDTSLLVGLQDAAMIDGTAGYAVGNDGLIMKYYSAWDMRFDEVLRRIIESDVKIVNVSVQLNQSTSQLLDAIEKITLTGNVSVDFSELINITRAMNESLSAQIGAIDGKMEQMNASMQIKLDAIESNVTYTQVYLENVVEPFISNILVSLGIIEAKLNQSIELQNQTLQNVTKLVEYAERPRAWTTQ